MFSVLDYKLENEAEGNGVEGRFRWAFSILVEFVQVVSREERHTPNADFAPDTVADIVEVDTGI